MGKFGFSAMALACVAVVGIGIGYAQAPKPMDVSDDPIVATVDGVAIHKSDVAQMQRNLPPQYQQLPLEVLFPAVIERLIDAKLVAAAGRKEGLQNDAQVKQRIAQFEERVIQEAYLTKRVDAAVTDEAVQKRFETMKSAGGGAGKEEVKARHILVQTEAQAKEVIVELKKGGDFAELAKTKSLDPSGKQQGGDLGYFSREEMVPEFSEAAFKLKDGEMTDTPVKTQFGYHVIKVEARRTTTIQIEEVREDIVNDIQKEVVEAELGKLRTGAKVERFNLDGSPRK
jgi:peptidyl-prolyl cis-trans isomerase C